MKRVCPKKKSKTENVLLMGENSRLASVKKKKPDKVITSFVDWAEMVIN